MAATECLRTTGWTGCDAPVPYLCLSDRPKAVPLSESVGELTASLLGSPCVCQTGEPTTVRGEAPRLTGAEGLSRTTDPCYPDSAEGRSPR